MCLGCVVSLRGVIFYWQGNLATTLATWRPAYDRRSGWPADERSQLWDWPTFLCWQPTGDHGDLAGRPGDLATWRPRLGTNRYALATCWRHFCCVLATSPGNPGLKPHISHSRQGRGGRRPGCARAAAGLHPTVVRTRAHEARYKVSATAKRNPQLYGDTACAGPVPAVATTQNPNK